MERRLEIVIRGIVQGVGFRPFVYNLATRLQLGGFVQNQAGSVFIEVEGKREPLDWFLIKLRTRPPPLAQIEDFTLKQREPLGERQFRILSSDSDTAGAIFISPDVATCEECLAELFDPNNRRYGYPFLNCTNCGPRLTIITAAPYDRPRTTMASFALCLACQSEYEDPHDRRFHAQPTACPVCGPQLQLLDDGGVQIQTADPLIHLAAALVAGKIGAIKGLGGFHLACDARNSAAVAELRRRKHRDEKPFAVMVAGVAAAAECANAWPEELSLLASARRPIVLLRRLETSTIANEVAPGNARLGIMLPYTPLHHLLMRAVGGIPLVMTSGNRSDEPIVYQNDAAYKLRGIADLFLVHDRPIHVRCDDSVTQVVRSMEQTIRRSRGYAPRPIEMPFSCPRPILAVGGQLKVTFALGQGRQAFLSHHLGDLDHFEAYRAFEHDIELYQKLFAIYPKILAHDLHPDYQTSRYARERAGREGTRVLAVQHHHAHMASCMAEHGLTRSVIGVTFDGTGYGTDGAVWGGEFLVGDYRHFIRAAHLRYVGMPGGDQAIREPWRMALAHLKDAGPELTALKARLSRHQVSTVEKMLERRFNTPWTSSAGRLFDAVAALLGVRDRVSYEGQAAIELEALAMKGLPDRIYPYELSTAQASQPLLVDTRPLIRYIVEEACAGVSSASIARRFHHTLVDIIATVCDRLRQSTGINDVVLSGGVFLNAVLSEELYARLEVDGFGAYHHHLVPPNDGGLSLGQLAIAAALSEESNDVPRHSRQSS